MLLLAAVMVGVVNEPADVYRHCFVVVVISPASLVFWCNVDTIGNAILITPRFSYLQLVRVNLVGFHETIARRGET